MAAQIVPADKSIRPSRVQNIDTERLLRRSRFIAANRITLITRYGDRSGRSASGGLGTLAKEMVTIERELTNRLNGLLMQTGRGNQCR